MHHAELLSQPLFLSNHSGQLLSDESDNSYSHTTKNDNIGNANKNNDNNNDGDNDRNSNRDTSNDNNNKNSFNNYNNNNNNKDNNNNDNNGDIVYEVTSSGLTHTCADNIITKHLNLCPLMLDTFPSHRYHNYKYKYNTADSTSHNNDDLTTKSTTTSSSVSSTISSEDVLINQDTAVNNKDTSSTTANNDNDNKQYYIGKNYGLITLQYSERSKQGHELNVSVYSMESHKIVLSTIILPIISEKINKLLHIKNISISINNTIHNNRDDNYYYHTFFKLSAESSANIIITVLSMVVGFIYVILKLCFYK